MDKFFNKCIKYLKKIFSFLFSFGLFLFLRKFFYDIIKFVDNASFLFEGIKSKLAFINRRFFDLPGASVRYKRNEKEFQDLTTSVPIYKVFFVINKALARAYKFYYRLANRIIEPTSKFFEALHINRKHFYRFTIYPRKHYKERIIDFHTLFLKRYFFFKMQKSFKYSIILFFFFNFLFFENIIVSLLFTFIFHFNFLFFFFFCRIFDIKLKKSILGLKLNNSKNFNINNGNNFYIYKGFSLLDLYGSHRDPFTSKKESRLHLQTEINTMFKFLKLNIDEIFDLIKLNYKIESEDLKTFENEFKYKSYKEEDMDMGIKNFFFKEEILEKTLAIVGYLYNWRLFAALNLYDVEEFKEEKDQHKSNNEKFFTYKLINFMNTDIRSFISFFTGPEYLEKYEKRLQEDHEYNNYLLLQDFFERKHIEEDQFEVCQKKTLKIKILKNLIKIFNFSYLHLILSSEDELQNMIKFIGKYKKRQNLLTIKVFNYEINLNNFNHLKMADLFKFNGKEFDIFLHLFFKKSINNKMQNDIFGTDLEKYMILIENEKKIFLVEQYLNNLKIFILDLLTFYFVNFSKNNKNHLIEKNKMYFILEDQFKFILKEVYDQEFIDDFKFYNDDLNDILLFLLNKLKFKKNLEKNMYRRREICFDIFFMDYDYNMNSLCKYQKENSSWKFFYIDKTKFNYYYQKASRPLSYNKNNKIFLNSLDLDTMNINELIKKIEKIYQIKVT
jgi:hypothetical protein